MQAYIIILREENNEKTKQETRISKRHMSMIHTMTEGKIRNMHGYMMQKEEK